MEPSLIFVVITQMNDTMQQLMFTLMRLRSALSTGPAEESFAVAASPPNPRTPSFFSPVLLPWLFPTDVVLHICVCYLDWAQGCL